MNEPCLEKFADVHPGYDAPETVSNIFANLGGIRDVMISAYEIPRHFYAVTRGQAAYKMRDIGCLIYYALERGKMARKVKKIMDVDGLVEKWRKAVVGLCVAHDKDEADRFEANLEECLSPILTAPIKQVREFAPKLLEVLKNDKQVPFMVWRAYEVWYEQVIAKAPDQEVKELKTKLAKEIVDIVEEDVKPQLADAMVRALQWRSSEKLEEVKQVDEKEKAAGRPVRLRGRESCLFLEAGGTEETPAVCVQV